MRKILLVISLVLPLLTWAQSGMRKNRDVFPAHGNLERKGWIFSPALTYMAPGLRDANERLYLGGGVAYDVDYNAAGKVGVGFEFGRFYSIDVSRLISYVDFSMGAKIFRGTETFEASLYDPNGESQVSREGNGVFRLNYATAAFDAHNIQQFSDYMFLQNSLGVNFDYKFGEDIYFNNRDLPIAPATAPEMLLQLHYRLGFGFKLSQKILLIPSVETPILTFIEYEDMKSSMAVFNSRYRPLTFRLTVMLFDNKAQRKCPPKGGKRTRKSSESLFGMSDSDRPW